MPIENGQAQQEQSTEQNDLQKDFEHVQREVQQLKDNDKSNDKFEEVSGKLTTEFANFLTQSEENKEAANDLFEQCKKYYESNPTVRFDYGFVSVYNFLEMNLKNSGLDLKLQAEIRPENINAKLRGKWNKEGVDLEKVKQGISDKLNSYVVMWNYLPENVQNILKLTQDALKSHTDENDTSPEIFALEQELSRLGAMNVEQTSNEIHDGVDGKFGDKTFDALINYIEGSLKNAAEIEPKNINAKLRGKWNKEGVDLEKVKQEISDKLNGYTEMWDCLSEDVKRILVLSKIALGSKTDPNNDDKSNEILVLEQELARLGAMNVEQTSNEIHDGVDGKFGDKTFDALINYIEGSLKQSAEIDSSKINVTLRGDRKTESPEKQTEIKLNIANTLNKYSSNFEYLSTESKRMIILAKMALYSTCDGDDKSKEVEYLEKALNMPDTHSSEVIHDGVDGRFGPKTFVALLKYLDDEKLNNI